MAKKYILSLYIYQKSLNIALKALYSPDIVSVLRIFTIIFFGKRIILLLIEISLYFLRKMVIPFLKGLYYIFKKINCFIVLGFYIALWVEFNFFRDKELLRRFYTMFLSISSKYFPKTTFQKYMTFFKNIIWTQLKYILKEKTKNTIIKMFLSFFKIW